MKLNRIKLVLDVALTLVLGLLYTVHAQLGLAWHEWAGIAIAVAFIVHIVLSWDWVVAVTKRLFGRTTPRARFLYVLDVLVLATMGWTIVSGVLISRVAVPQLAVGAMPIFRVTHVPVSYLTLVVIGVHLGMHWDWALGVFRRVAKRPRLTGSSLWVARGVAALVLVGGAYSVVATNTIGQSLATFGVASAGQTGGFGDHGGRGRGEPGGGFPGGVPGGAFPDGGSRDGNMGAPPFGDNHDGAMGRGRGEGGGAGGSRGSDALSLLLHTGVIAAFAVPTYYIDRALAGRRRRRPNATAAALS